MSYYTSDKQIFFEDNMESLDTVCSVCKTVTYEGTVSFCDDPMCPCEQDPAMDSPEEEVPLDFSKDY